MFKTVHHAIPMQKLQTLLPAPSTLKTSRLADYLSSQNQFMDWSANVKTLQSMSWTEVQITNSIVKAKVHEILRSLNSVS
jgi:hypothetical protein